MSKIVSSRHSTWMGIGGIGLGMGLGIGLIAPVPAVGATAAAAAGEAIATPVPVRWDPATAQLVDWRDALGNRIPDFSQVGYANGQEPLPDVATLIPDPDAQRQRWIVISPSGGDDTAAIQGALDRLAALPPLANGWRGVVQLTAGEFQIAGQLQLLASGLVLRGEAAPPQASPPDSSPALTPTTTLLDTGRDDRPLIVVGRANIQWQGLETARTITDPFVPVGALSMAVASTAGWQVGDRVVIHRPYTAAWIRAIGMDRLPPRSDRQPVQPWPASDWREGRYERRIVGIQGDRVLLDAPVVDALDQRYGGGTLQRFTVPDRLERVGIENLRAVAGTAHNFLVFRRVEQAWARRIVGEQFGFATVWIQRAASQITVSEAASLVPRSPIAPTWRYPFNLEGQRSLMQDLYSEQARHDFVQNVPARGPNVFHGGIAVQALGEAGPHQRWSTGTLFDHLWVQGHRFAIRNNGNFGDGHGWTGANMVLWNSMATAGIALENPPTARNWAIGSVGPLVMSDRFGPPRPPLVAQPNQPVRLGNPVTNPTGSLYLAQRHQRDRDPLLGEWVWGDFDAGARVDPGDRPLSPLPAAIASWATTQGLPMQPFDAASDRPPGQPALVPLRFQPGNAQLRAAVLTVAIRPQGTRRDPLPQLWLETPDGSSLEPLPVQTWERPMPVGDGQEHPTRLAIIPLGEKTLRSRLADGDLVLAIVGSVPVDWAVLDWRGQPSRLPAMR